MPLAAVANYLVRRGTDGSDEDKPFPVLGFSIFVLTLVILAITSGCLDYIYGKVVATLAAVEDPNPDVYVRIETDATVETGINDAELPPPKPITRSLGSTLAHLKSRAGRLSRFRGIRLYLLIVLIVNLVASPIAAILGGSLVGNALGQFIAELLVANLRVGWIHIVISEPSTKSLWSRLPAWRKTIWKIAPAAAIRSVASQVATFVPLLIASSSSLMASPSDIAPTTFVSSGLGLSALYLALYVLIQMPAEVTFIRVAASMLPEDDEAIVPFDRSFGGKVTPEIVGGQGKIGIVDAWRSFNWGSRMRFLNIVGRVFLLQMAVSFIFALVLISQVFLFFAAGRMLSRQLQQMQSDKDIPGISCGLVNDNSVFEWEVMLMISDDCKFYGGGFFRARLSFPPEYPHMPPKMKFETPIFHPNIYENGDVCISILHPPEEDKYGYESAAERWSPVQTPETILLSVISMLSSPNDESPANVEAARLWRDDPKEFKKRVRKCVRESLGED
ncbi:ubiquitin-conjugating enzyme/RWD-like protein [Talaromyces proteolyticus]|uniref:Ubiquitin-conjugating enzyme E2 2 n=1 Tax=Talaromyces proteolyticus TaxID=1131652 RepID=A0AAD4KEH7_9EURO|nr:ubiquitin-conjugating enzyme/RWD-like protein [Talaromyces proteolyticus]KAH8690030.1 ubiquitin-conjugating enzyme/RWD-like protein [Talaromyces proteolyticus]